LRKAIHSEYSYGRDQNDNMASIDSWLAIRVEIFSPYKAGKAFGYVELHSHLKLFIMHAATMGSSLTMFYIIL